MAARSVATNLGSQVRLTGSAMCCRAASGLRPAFRSQSTWSRSSSGSAASRSSRSLWSLTAAVSLGLSAAYLSSSKLYLDAAPSTVQTAASLPALSQPQSQVVIDADTNQSLPLYLPIPASSLPAGTGKLKLVGLGVRTVSFLRVRVYVAALYVDESKLQQLAKEGGFAGNATSVEERVRMLVDQGAACAIRIVPVRSTDFAHLRDGFVRALQGRLKKAIKASNIASGSATEEAFSNGITEVKDCFPRGSVPKGSALDLVLVPSFTGSSLNFEYDGKVFGSVKASDSAQGFTIARELALAYFSETGEISTPFKKSVEQGLAEVVGETGKVAAV
ncbi:hypothetical protein ACQY0O_001940 [Thecaphora frezii]